MKLAVIVRGQDGVFQPLVVGALRCANLYQLTGCVLRKISPEGGGPAILSITEMSEDGFVFVNARLESVNHLCLPVLSEQLQDPDCGVVSPQVIASGAAIERDPEGTVSEQLFGVRRELLMRVGGLALVAGGRLDRLFTRLVEEATASGFQVRIASKALAVLAESGMSRVSG